MNTLVQNVRVALRRLRRNPGVTAVAVLSLALGIGANAAIFSVVDAVLLRPLPYPKSDDLVAVYTRFLPSSGLDFPYFPLSGPEFLDLREHVPGLAAAAYVQDARNLTLASGDPERVQVIAATADLFTVLRTRPTLGRTFAQGDDAPGAPCVAVLGFGLWQERFGADRGALSRDIRLDGAPCRIVGVMSQGFGFPDDRFRLYTNLTLDTASPWWNRGSHNLLTVTRLGSGLTVPQVDAQLAALHESWLREFPEDHYEGHFAVQRSLGDDLVGDTRQPLLLVFGAVGLVLLMICANLASLLLARSESRRHEMAIRTALGADRGRLVRQLFVEHLALGLVGGGAGLLLAGPMLLWLLALEPGLLPRTGEIALNAAAVAFSLGISIVAAFAFGILPAFRSASIMPQAVLQSDGRTVSAGRLTIRRALVVAEVALSLLLVAGATFLVRSYVELRGVDLGLRPDGVLTFGLFTPEQQYPDLAGARRLHAELHDRLTAAPGVRAVGAISDLPLLSGGAADNFLIEGRPYPAPGELQWNARYLMVTASTFETLGIPLVHGRLLDERDVDGQPLVAVINEAAARTFWPDEDPIGRRIRYQGESEQPWLTIVGVVDDVHQLGPGVPPPPAVYTPHAQTSRVSSPYGRFLTVVVRGDGAPEDLIGTVRAVLAAIDPGLPLADVQSMREVVDLAMGQPRFTMLLMLAFAVVALLLGVLGIYGVLAHTVAQRTREIGLRLALGATRGEVTAIVVREGMTLAAAGVGLGLVGVLAAHRALRSVLFSIDARDPFTLAVVTLLLLGVSFAACYLPARRASRVDPMIALRTE